MIEILETCRDYKATIPLSFLQISDLCTVPARFYESSNKKSWMCELCMFSQIQLPIMLYAINLDGRPVRCVAKYVTLMQHVKEIAKRTKYQLTTHSIIICKISKTFTPT